MNAEKVIWFLLIGYLTGIAVSMVGKIPSQCSEPYTWGTTFGVLAIIIFPSMLAYVAGVKDGKK